VLTGARFDG